MKREDKEWLTDSHVSRVGISGKKYIIINKEEKINKYINFTFKWIRSFLFILFFEKFLNYK